MTHPDVLHLTRSCAKWRAGVLLVAVLAACTSAAAAPSFRLLGSNAPGDSLRIGVLWGAPTGRVAATGYRVTVVASATNGTWTGLPAVLPVPAPGTSVQFIAVNAAWDSVTFTATVESVDANGPSGKTSTSSPWRLKRRVGPPGPVTFDSSLTITGTLLYPESVRVFLGETKVLCAFGVFWDGKVGEHTVTKGSCDSLYVRHVPVALRPTAAQQRVMDSLPYSCIDYEVSNPTAGLLTTPVPCAGLARVTGLKLSLRRPVVPAPSFQYVETEEYFSR